MFLQPVILFSLFFNEEMGIVNGVSIYPLTDGCARHVRGYQRGYSTNNWNIQENTWAICGALTITRGGDAEQAVGRWSERYDYYCPTYLLTRTYEKGKEATTRIRNQSKQIAELLRIVETHKQKEQHWLEQQLDQVSESLKLW